MSSDSPGSETSERKHSRAAALARAEGVSRAAVTQALARLGEGR